MDLSPKNFPKSEIEDNKEFVKLGVEVVYYGLDFAEYYTVVAFDDIGFTLADSGGEESSYEYSSLQLGWEFHNIDRYEIILPDGMKRI